MANDIVVDFFKAAKSQLEQAVRWHLIALAAVLYLDVGIVVPFAARTAEKAQVESALADHRQAEEAVSPLAASTKALSERIGQEAARVSEGLVENLRDSFSRLSVIVSQLSQMSVQDAQGFSGEMLFRQEQLPQMQSAMQMQMPEQAEQAEPGLPPMPPELASGLATAGAGSEMSAQVGAALDDYIQTAIIEPAFVQANADWEQSLGWIAPDLTAAISASEVAEAEAGAFAEQVGGTARQLRELEAAAKELHFDTPADQDWWRSVVGKQAAVAEMMQAFDSELRNTHVIGEDLTGLQSQISETIAAGEQLQASIDAELTNLEERSREIQSTLGAVGGPLSAIAFSLGQLAPFLPAIIAAVSGVAILLTAEALRRMRLAVERAPAEERKLLSPWLADAAGSSPAWMTVRSGLLFLATAGWIWQATMATAGLSSGALFPASLATLSIGLVLACRAWLWREALLALRFVRTTAV